MRIHWFQHAPYEDLGVIEGWARSRAHPIHGTRWFAGDPVPALPDVDLLIIMGGVMSVHDDEVHPWLRAEKAYLAEAIAAGKKALGICLGAQLIAHVMGARVSRMPHKEIGWFRIRKTEEAVRSDLAAIFPGEMEVFHWHGETFDLPAGSVQIARSAACENQAFVYEERVVGFQFHPEVTRRTVQAILDSCDGRTGEGPFVQSPEAILSDGSRFRSTNAFLIRWLDRLAGPRDRDAL